MVLPLKSFSCSCWLKELFSSWFLMVWPVPCDDCFGSLSRDNLLMFEGITPIFLPEFVSVLSLMQALLFLGVPNIVFVEIFFQAAGFGGRNKLFLVFSFSFLYYLPGKVRRSLWTLLGLLKIYEKYKNDVSNNCFIQL